MLIKKDSQLSMRVPRIFLLFILLFVDRPTCLYVKYLFTGAKVYKKCVESKSFGIYFVLFHIYM